MKQIRLFLSVVLVSLLVACASSAGISAAGVNAAAAALPPEQVQHDAAVLAFTGARLTVATLLTSGKMTQAEAGVVSARIDAISAEVERLHAAAATSPTDIGAKIALTLQAFTDVQAMLVAKLVAN